MTQFAPRVLLTAITFAAATTAQHLASFDPAATPTQEYAAVACVAAPGAGTTADLVSPSASAQWWLGATAADNDNQRLYYTTGKPAHGILRIAFDDIGTGIAPAVSSNPIGFNQITGMVVDPTDATGDTLFVTDGYVIIKYHAPSAAIVAGPFPAPVTGTNLLTGLAHNPFSGRLWTIDSSSNMHSRFVTGGPWLAQVPSVPVPARPTGISFCKTSGGPPFASYWNGTVVNVVTGTTMAFPNAPSGIRHHRGMTFVGTAIKLGGGTGGPELVPWVDVANGFKAGNATTQIVVENPTALGVIGVDTAPIFGAGINIPGIGGTLMLNPATTISLLLGPGTNTIPLGLVGVPPGIGMTLQAAGLNAGGLDLGDALHLTTHL